MDTLKLIGMGDVGIKAARVAGGYSDWECVHAGVADDEALVYMRQQARLHGVELRVELVHKEEPDDLHNRAYCYVPKPKPCD